MRVYALLTVRWSWVCGRVLCSLGFVVDFGRFWMFRICSCLCWSHCLRGGLVDNSDIYEEAWYLRRCLKDWVGWGNDQTCEEFASLYTFLYWKIVYVAPSTNNLSASHSAVSSDRRYRLAPINQNQVVKAEACIQVYPLQYFPWPCDPDQDARHLAATGTRQPALRRRCWYPKTG